MTSPTASFVPLLLTGLICTGLGFGLALAVSGSESPRVAPPTAEESADWDQGPGRNNSRAGAARSGMASARDASSRRVDHTGAIEAAASGVRRSTVEAKTGSGVIRGVCLDEDGQPIPDVVIHAMRSDNENVYGQDPESIEFGRRAPRSLQETLKRAAESWSRREAGHFTARSGTDGQFEIPELPARPFQVFGQKDGFVFEGENLWRVFPGQRAELTGFAVSLVEVQIRMPDGSAPEQAALRIDSERTNHTVRWTPDSTVVPVPAGEGSLMAFAEIDTDLPMSSFQTARFQSESVVIEEQPTEQPIVLELEERCGVFGWIKTAEGSLPMRLVGIARIPDGVTPTKEWIGSHDDTNWEWLDTNYFLFSDRDPGSYALALGHTTENLSLLQTIELEGGITRIELEQPADSPQDYLRIEALKPDGRPLRYITVTAVAQGPEGPNWSNPDTIRKPDGSHWLRVDELASFDYESWPSGAAIEMTIATEKFGSRKLTLNPGQREVRVEFEATQVLTVYVRGDDLAGYTVSVDEPQEPSETNAVGQMFLRNYYFNGVSGGYESVQDGKAVFPRTAPGTWEITLFSPTSMVLAKQTVRVGSSPVDIEFTAPQLYELVVHVPGATASSSLSLMGLKPDGTVDDSRSAYAEPEEDERARFTGLPAGRYRLMSGDGVNTRDLTVPSSEVVFEVQALDAMKVAISDANGRLAQAGFEAGDLITAVDGTELTPETVWSVFWEGLSRARSELTVRRGTKTLTITVEGFGPLLNNPNGLGGSFNPAPRN